MKIVISIVSLLFCLGTYATKPCPSSPCFVDGKFNESACIGKSDWIAIGRINQIVDDYVGHPINKNLSSFTLNIESWQKNPDNYPDVIELKVGWCNNPKELPRNNTESNTEDSKENKTDLFIFYGKQGLNSKPEYYWFRKKDNGFEEH